MNESFDNGRFVARRQLGVGGSGVVYEVDDRQWGEVLALKLLRVEDPALLHRFKREFRALVELAHPNLIRMHELFARDGRWFFTMEHVDGQDWVSYVGAGPDRLRAALGQLVDGVAALHESGKLHRDLKPSNVLVTRAGRVKICDAGLVTATDGELQTRSAHARGTPLFMSPEQAANRPLSTASDWYSVGAMLYLALTGRAPFSGNPLIVMRDKQLVDPPAPAELADVPGDLDALCRALLQRAPDQRPGAAEIFAQLRIARPAPRARSEASADVVEGRASDAESIPCQTVDTILDAWTTMKGLPRSLPQSEALARLAAERGVVVRIVDPDRMDPESARLLSEAGISWAPVETQPGSLDDLSPDALTLLRLLSVAPTPLARVQLAASARGLVSGAQAAWSELRRLGLVRASGDLLTVAHPQVREQVLASMTRLELDGCRRRLSRQVPEPL
jgi:serine/threonine protein kinase